MLIASNLLHSRFFVWKIQPSILEFKEMLSKLVTCNSHIHQPTSECKCICVRVSIKKLGNEYWITIRYICMYTQLKWQLFVLNSFNVSVHAARMFSICSSSFILPNAIQHIAHELQMEFINMQYIYSIQRVCNLHRINTLDLLWLAWTFHSFWMFTMSMSKRNTVSIFVNNFADCVFCILLYTYIPSHFLVLFIAIV